ncbi:hypothetical protein CMQ_6437 [Grosmannia clavigera kw1407]|uniref:Uncharacterized protein n=1 Tax=Grosmannia clavigera (strain kw1407 / UAMH 11150) TaxID=655863 RepID=F0XLS4_GROCL|nr:uncharacterized protein CMQ_6437 [Grosmannia clavigera kw1407]EFX01495.1 hypothetical protein CMQ_6437 [Grosmannia clavigera kw1407]
MPLASPRLRLAVRSSSLASTLPPSPARIFRTNVATAEPTFDRRGRNNIKTSQRHISSSAAVAIAASRPVQQPGSSEKHTSSDGATIVSATTANVASQSSGVDHLKRRGHFLPSPLARDPAADKGPGLGLQHNRRSLLGAQHYGKWRDLLFDYDRLMFEAGLTQSSHSVRDAKRSVDLPEHATDLGLWSAIFNFAQRREDREGALVVWREILDRKQLHQTDGVVAISFWQSVVESALEDEAFLESTWAYAEWMHDEHDAHWPNYYRTIVTFCLDNGQYDRALQWHLRLGAHFGVARRDFFDMLKAFISDPEPELQDTLHCIYATSHHRQLYDTIVPLLWSEGHSTLAQTWRETLIRHDDIPLSTGASRPFLQYLAGYYPETELHSQEQTVLNSRPVNQAPAPRQPAEKTADMPKNLYHLMNRVHGETFGIQEKQFNDKIGAKWFATSWVSLDTAINLVSGLGILEIGPLSLQSIALRENGPAGVSRRLQQLDELQISVGQSNYARGIRHLAKMGDGETLDKFLHSTIHPDVFDDVVLQRYVLGSASFTGDWETHHLLLAMRLAVSEDSLVATSNQLLQTCLDQRRKKATLKLMDEFAAKNIELLPSTCESMSDLILAEVPRQFDPNAIPDVDFCIALCRRLATLRLPVATEAWQNILVLLGRQGRLADLEAIAVDVASRYVSIQAAALPAPKTSPASSLPGANAAFKVHVADVPDVLRDESPSQTSDIGYRLLPRDLALDHPLHPLSLIFDRSMVEAVVRWYFHRKLAYRQGQNVRSPIGNRLGKQPVPSDGAKKAASPGDFSLAGGIRLLAILRDRGVAVPTAIVRSEALVCIAAVFGPPSMATRYWQPARSANQLTVREVKDLCDAAWATSGSRGGAAEAEELLPALDVLEKALKAVRPVANSFGNQLTRRGDKKKMSREAFIDAVSQQPGIEPSTG